MTILTSQIEMPGQPRLITLETPQDKNVYDWLKETYPEACYEGPYDVPEHPLTLKNVLSKQTTGPASRKHFGLMRVANILPAEYDKDERMAIQTLRYMFASVTMKIGEETYRARNARALDLLTFFTADQSATMRLIKQDRERSTLIYALGETFETLDRSNKIINRHALRANYFLVPPQLSKETVGGYIENRNEILLVLEKEN